MKTYKQEVKTNIGNRLQLSYDKQGREISLFQHFDSVVQNLVILFLYRLKH